MTDAPEGPAGAQPERGGGRRPPRVGDSGSPVGSTLSIVLAVVAVVAGFLILRAITNDDDSGGDITLDTVPTDGSDVTGSGPESTTASTGTTATPTTVNKQAATVVVANASGIGGSAGAMSTALQTAGYILGTPGNSTGAALDTSVVYYAVGDVTAQGVATAVATDMGGIAVAEMPTPPPIDTGLGTATVLVMLGTDTANKTLADLSAAAVAPPAGAGVTTTTVAGD